MKGSREHGKEAHKAHKRRYTEIRSDRHVAVQLLRVAKNGLILVEQPVKLISSCLEY